jgi:glycerophosphoryl diester phosphodiesterase
MRDASTFVAIAHRGFSSQAPENTIAAFDFALENGFNNIELDVQLTSDKVPVIIHDAKVDRTTDGTGEVSSLSLVNSRKLDAGSWFNAKYAGERIPTLEEVLQRYDGKTHLHLELKSNDPNLPKIVAQALRDNNWLRYATAKPFTEPGLTITSKYIEQVERSIKLLPDVPHHWLSWEINDDIIARSLDLGLKGICIAARYADAQLIAKAKNEGLTIRGLEVKGNDDVKVLFAAGAEGTTTNWPDRVKELVVQ